MSYIFDALQKAAGEDSNAELSSLLGIELLEAAERKTAAERDSIAVEELRPLRQVESRPALKGIPSEVGQGTPDKTAPLGAPPRPITDDQLKQFQSLELPIIPHGRLVSLTDKGNLAAEKFRYLGVRLRQVQQQRALKKVLVTSTLPQEGKSMTAANLACTLARRTQEKTLLLDGDLRRPTLAQLFGIGRVPGISEWLHGDQRQITSIYKLQDAGLWLLPAGAAPMNPLELLQSQRLSMLFEQLTACFHWIVIDSPPVLPLADTSVWMRIADGILLVSRQGVTKKEQLKRGLEAIERTKLLGALLNGSTNTNDDGYYHYYGSSSDRTVNTEKSNT